MPDSVANAVPVGVWPNMTYLSLSKSSEWATNVNASYPDGSTQRYSLPAGSPVKPRARFRLRARLGIGTSVADGVITTGTPNLTSASVPWTAAIQGRAISVAGAGPGGLPLVTYVLTYVSAGAVTLGRNAGTTASSAEVIWSTTGNPPMGVLKALFTSLRGRLGATYYYYPWDRTVKFAYDLSGTETDGRYTVRLDSDFREEWNLQRGGIDLELVEIT